MINLLYDIKIWAEVSVVLSQFMRLTDGRRTFFSWLIPPCIHVYGAVKTAVGISPNLQLWVNLGEKVFKVNGHGHSETKFGQISTLGGIAYKLLVRISPD